MQKLSMMKLETTWPAPSSFKYRCWLPLTALCLAAIPCISVASSSRPTSRPPQGAGPNTVTKQITRSDAPKTPTAQTPVNPTHNAKPAAVVPQGAGPQNTTAVARSHPAPPAPTTHHSPKVDPRPVPQGAGPTATQQVAQAPQPQQTSPTAGNSTSPPVTQAIPEPRSDNNNHARIGLPMDPLPANPLPNSTALKPASATIAAVMNNNKSTPVQAAAATTASNVPSLSVDTAAVDTRSSALDNLQPGPLTSKLIPLPGNLPILSSTNQLPKNALDSQSPCTKISTQAHTQRPDTSLVDLTGDGLIVSALPNAHVRASLHMAGYKQISLGQPSSWCLPATAMSALLRSPAFTAQRNSPQQRLVQIKGQWQLVQSTTAVNNRAAVNRKASSNLQLQGQAFKALQRAG